MTQQEIELIEQKIENAVLKGLAEALKDFVSKDTLGTAIDLHSLQCPAKDAVKIGKAAIVGYLAGGGGIALIIVELIRLLA